MKTNLSEHLNGMLESLKFYTLFYKNALDFVHFYLFLSKFGNNNISKDTLNLCIGEL